MLILGENLLMPSAQNELMPTVKPLAFWYVSLTVLIYRRS